MKLPSASVMRMLELLSVFPAYLQGEVMKQIYVQGINKKKHFDLMVSGFMNSTADLVTSKLTPGGFYTGVWCRDASYILNESFIMGKRERVSEWLEWIWRHQIGGDDNHNNNNNNGPVKFVHGRGSPEMSYRMVAAASQKNSDSTTGVNFFSDFAGALPTSIQNGYCEVYGKSPDVDSTALMTSVTCKCCMGNERLAVKLIPRLRNAVKFLESRDLDGDFLLEQGPNEDWMDRMLRSGKLVYNQGLWIAALRQWSALLRNSGKNEEEADKADAKADHVTEAVESKLWRSDRACYADQSTIGGNPTDVKITQDIFFFLLAIRAKKYSQDRIGQTMATTQRVLWKKHGSACQEPPSTNTVPPTLGPYKYQNGGVWSWTNATEILARLSYGQIKEPRILLERILPVAHLEWIDPNNTRSGGAFPFRTGIAATRTALREFLRLSHHA